MMPDSFYRIFFRKIRKWPVILYMFYTYQVRNFIDHTQYLRSRFMLHSLVHFANSKRLHSLFLALRAINRTFYLSHFYLFHRN